MTKQPTIYDLAGGDAPFRKLVDAFYTRVEHEPLLRPMYPEDLTASREHMFLFITQYFGGPARYNALRGHPRLRMRHFPFTIGQAARNTWVAHMFAAIDEVGFQEPIRGVLRDYFDRTATFLINQTGPETITIGAGR